jgi:hypothetical protein
MITRVYGFRLLILVKNSGVEDLRTAVENAKLVYDAYDGFTSCIPDWYRRAK